MCIRDSPHEVLNAKFHEREAEIVALAGQHGAVTIATNMAGRGTDIKLDDDARAAGGLKIIGTERHEARRIDNQLRGRSGRQGDPGESRFYISLEDDQMCIRDSPGGFTPRAEKVLKAAEQEAARFHERQAGTEHILIAMLKDVECAASRLLNTMNVNVKELYSAMLDSMGKTGRDYREESARSGRSQSRGTQTLDQYSRDLTRLARERKLEPCIGREDEIRRLLQTLSRRTKNNPCLIGEPGVGKTAMVE